MLVGGQPKPPCYPATVLTDVPAEAEIAFEETFGPVAILEIVEGPVRFVDTRKNERDGKVYLRPAQTVVAGVPFGRPYNAPFTVR